ncbi:8198_t:CDS:2, partial [Scutellospora calospora]
AWGSGDKAWYSLLALRLRQMGYVVVVPNFTLYPKAKVDVMLSDIKRSLGHSSGAHLGALVTIRDSIIKSQTIEGKVGSNLNDIDPELELPKIAGLILMAGVFDIGRHFLWEARRGVEEISPMGRVMGDTPETFEMNSPTLLLQNATKDREDETVPLESTLRFSSALNDLNIEDLRLRVMTGMEHSDTV